jgi:surface polysaccharide O-acyltransferase-like enzyme
MFYPATSGFVLTGIGFAILTLWVTSYHPEAAWYAPLRWLGASALFIYILHNAIIHFWLENVFPDRPLGEFMAINFATLAFLVLVAWGLGRLARAWPNRPFLVRFLLGG